MLTQSLLYSQCCIRSICCLFVVSMASANSVTSVDAANTASAVPGSVGMFALPDVVTVVAPLIASIDAAVDSQTPVPSPDRSRARRERVVHSTAIVATPR